MHHGWNKYYKRAIAEFRPVSRFGRIAPGDILQVYGSQISGLDQSFTGFLLHGEYIYCGRALGGDVLFFLSARRPRYVIAWNLEWLPTEQINQGIEVSQ